MNGLKKACQNSKTLGTDPRHERMHRLVTGAFPNFKTYLRLFLDGSFLKHYEEFYKKKPKAAESEYWFGNKTTHRVSCNASVQEWTLGK